MITPTFEYNYYKTHRGICINGDCENVIRDYVSNHYKKEFVSKIHSLEFGGFLKRRFLMLITKTLRSLIVSK